MIRAARREDWPVMQQVWRAAVEATHDFLTADDLTGIESALIPEYFPAVELIVAEEHGDVVGFAGVHGTQLEMLFVHPSCHGRGVGTGLLTHVVEAHGVDSVDVNEQNPAAVSFYLARGFVVVGWSETDEAGRPFPLLHLRLPAHDEA